MSVAYDPTDLDAEAERQSRVTTGAQQEAQWEIDDLGWLMGSKRGRRVMWRLLENAGVYRSSYTPGDAFATAFQEGNRNMGLRLLALIQRHCSSDYGLMVQERSNV